jgi:hypothetical protein
MSPLALRRSWALWHEEHVYRAALWTGMLMSQLALRQWSRSTMGKSRSLCCTLDTESADVSATRRAVLNYGHENCSHRVLHYGHRVC